jgi:hypothetical protein
MATQVDEPTELNPIDQELADNIKELLLVGFVLIPWHNDTDTRNLMIVPPYPHNIIGNCYYVAKSGSVRKNKRGQTFTDIDDLVEDILKWSRQFH